MREVEAEYYTAEDLARRIEADPSDWIPDDFKSGHTLVYSSPATLAFNSPGAEGFGVKRAALCLPESIELIVSPRCCGHMSTDLPGGRELNDRIFFMELSETDLVTGRYIKRIPDEAQTAVDERTGAGFPKPKAVMLVFTCVDALLGTDMDYVAAACEKKTGIRVVPAPMYALTREGMNPPMVQVRRSIFSLLEKRERNPHAVNVLGSLGGITKECREELEEILFPAGITKIRTLSDCKTFEEFKEMADAGFNIVIDQDARAAAADMQEKLGIGYIELQRFYGADRISSQYTAFCRALGTDSGIVDKLQKEYEPHIPSGDFNFSIGECENAIPAELALALLEYGFDVSEVFCALAPRDAWYILHIAEKNPNTKFFFNQHPSMVGFRPDPDADICIGKDACWYYRDQNTNKISFNSDRQPFGFSALQGFFKEISDSNPLKLEKYQENNKVRNPDMITDQSGAVSVVFPMDSLTVIIDAGGCTGNICGFDEPRWFSQKAVIFSAGLRDMDAIMGRDRELIRKIKDAAELLHPSFITLIGTPVPSTIGTDYAGLKRELEKQTGIPVAAVNTNGMESREKGVDKAKRALKSIFPDQI
ncbi:MAG: oxidoreductase [Lachnospiraceae bacterium]|uniref:Oxidoreductase n=1 Tax=Candidatus Weimeria bifida TaxID=2599074 RepID=A0A6N7J104_9FIRM|nr:oxidoreductase [Candidatus Weimeria bifida]RRF97431.1 MAG: oxidoreductase [Lachnospiraceae bacterium]